jgi:UDP-N-acetylmuramoylalanine--D-glutamate ligase
MSSTLPCYVPPRCRGLRVCVLGAGRSGVAAARLLAAHGGRVTLLDAAPRARLAQAAAALADSGARLVPAARTLPETPFDLCVVSPAFAADHPWLRLCAARGIPVIAEMELGAANWRGGLLAVTGSKGKSSVVKLCAETLAASGLPAAPAGNYGTPLCELALERPRLAWAVTEASSFQLEHVLTLRPRVAVLLNIQADHLDRHRTPETYAGLKLSLFARQGAGDTAVLPAELAAAAGTPAGVARHTFGAGAGADWRYTPGTVRGKTDGRLHEIAVRGTWFDNEVLGPAAAAAACALTACGLDGRQIAAGLAAFTPLPHRMEVVARGGGVTYVDDSKATTLTAMTAALRMLPGPARLIAGGRLKESDLDAPKEMLAAKVRKVYLVGESAPCLREAWSAVVACEVCGEMAAAVRAASRDARTGETVLLSPGCASFDQFENYGQRGACFARLARETVAAAASAAAVGEQEKQQ